MKVIPFTSKVGTSYDLVFFVIPFTSKVGTSYDWFLGPVMKDIPFISKVGTSYDSPKTS